ETPLERGTYLMQSIVACGNCHTPKDRDGQPIADRELVGGFVINAPIFHSVSPNITPDKETGIGNWTDDQIVDAIRNGKRPDGTIIGPPMPIAYYRNLSDTTCVRSSRICLQSSRSRTRPRNRPTKSPCRLSTGPPSPACPICRAPTKSHTADISRWRLGIAWTARSDAQVKDAIAQGKRPDRAVAPRWRVQQRHLHARMNSCTLSS